MTSSGENTDREDEYSVTSDLSLSQFDFSTTDTDHTYTELESSVKQEKWSDSPSKLDKIADQIINTVTIKGQKRLIDQDNPEDNITYEESERRLILLGFSLAILLGLSSLVLIVHFLQVQDLQVFVAEAKDKNQERIPVPHVIFMHRLGHGHMIGFKQVNQSYFDYTWQFKVPDQGGYIQTYFLFEDLANVYVVFSNRNLPTTVIRHSTIKKPQDYFQK